MFVAEPRRVYSAPEDVTEFRELVEKATFFNRSDDLPPARNGWEIVSTAEWLFPTPNDLLLGGPQNTAPYFDRCFAFANSLFGGPDYLAVDLHEDRWGWVVLTWFEYSIEDAPYPVIAYSFTEWLERTVASGPDARYWERPEFVDLGPAIPDHPNYRPPNWRARR